MNHIGSPDMILGPTHLDAEVSTVLFDQASVTDKDTRQDTHIHLPWVKLTAGGTWGFLKSYHERMRLYIMSFTYRLFRYSSG